MKDEENARLRSKLAKQRTEIARLTQKLEKLTEQKSEVVRDIKWMRGEKDG
jgi:septal ring factor EnvC (AmiA/AmiB activator)